MIGFVVVLLAAVGVSTGKICPGTFCGEFCDNGYNSDDNDCPLCYCASVTHCPTLNCFAACDDGYKVDVHNCPSCDCGNGTVVAPPLEEGLDSDDCPVVYCIRPCDVYAQDSNGCPTCTCANGIRSSINVNGEIDDEPKGKDSGGNRMGSRLSWWVGIAWLVRGLWFGKFRQT